MADQAAAPGVSAENLKNCAACGKPMKRAKRYYRNGKYYCNNNCFKGKGKAAIANKPKEGESS